MKAVLLILGLLLSGVVYAADNPPESNKDEGIFPKGSRNDNGTVQSQGDCVPAGDKETCGPGRHCQPGIMPGTGFCMKDPQPPKKN